jgi:hypothetical protein
LKLAAAQQMRGAPMFDGRGVRSPDSDSATAQPAWAISSLQLLVLRVESQHNLGNRSRIGGEIK